MKLYYTDVFPLPQFANSRFPLTKYRLLREHLQSWSNEFGCDFHVPQAASDEQLLLAHSSAYVRRVRDGHLSQEEQRAIGFPWTAELAERSRRSTGGTIEAARAALTHGQAAHLAGGTHHAFADYGEGFCVFNDVAVASRVLQSECQIERAVVIDLDVHQGNGTAAIFSADETVFTFSVHADNNFPQIKIPSDLDIALPDCTGDECYLGALREGIRKLPIADADLVFYLAGADPFEGDRLGRLKLTKSGLAARDRIVIDACDRAGVPLVVVLAGGYANSIQDIVEIHATTIELLCQRQATTHTPRGR